MVDEGMRSIGRRIGQIRTWRGMTLRAVAELAGITTSTWASFPTARKPGRGSPSRWTWTGSTTSYGQHVTTGVRGLPTLAALRAQRVAEELDDPAWFGLADWLRGFTLGGAEGRPRTLALSVRGADALAGQLDDPRAQQMYGMLHLNAALASAAMLRADDAATHLDEAGTIATRIIRADGRGFGGLYFGPDNVGIWRVSIAVELGDPGRVRELARQVNPARVPDAARQAIY